MLTIPHIDQGYSKKDNFKAGNESFLKDYPKVYQHLIYFSNSEQPRFQRQ